LVRAEDDDFLLRLYTAGRINELKAVGWNDLQIQQFCEIQYRARTSQYALTYKGALDQIVEFDGQSVGRLEVLESDQEIWLVDIALLPEFQNLGFGTELLEDLKEQASSANKPVRLHVFITNPGIRLYERLGFERVSYDGAYIEMEFRPNSVSR
jgi:ribosomal protein S18 acetylase RimI-like enzyme